MTFLKNKKGGEKYLSIWWFFCLTVIGVGIVAGVLIFYSADVDVRRIESDILKNKIINCIIENGKINEGKIDDIFESCYLDEKIVNQSGKYYTEIKIYDLQNCESMDFQCSLLQEKYIGNKDLKSQCEISAGKENEYFARCSDEKIYSTLNGKEVFVYVYAGSNYQGGEI